MDGFSPTVLCYNCGHTFTPRSIGPPISSDIIRSFRPLSSVETSQTTALIEEDELELKRVDAELNRIRFMLDKLESERGVICRRLEARRSQLAPIRKVPAEVLERILYLAQEDEFSIKARRNKSRSTIFALSQVCWYWRHIVTGRPAWWNTIRVDICQLDNVALPALEAHLKYSGDSELSLSVVDWRKTEFLTDRPPYRHCSKRLGECGPHTLHKLLQRNIHRIRYLELDFEMPVFDQLRLMGQLEGIFVNLRSLIITKPFTHDTAQQFLDTVPFDNRSSDQALLPNLQHLSLVYNPNEKPDLFLSRIRPQALQSFALRRFPHHYNRRIYGGSNTWPLASFTDMIRRSNSPIKKLDIDLGIYYLDIDEARIRLTSLLKLCTGLEELHLRLADFDPAALFHALFRSFKEAGTSLPLQNLKKVVVMLEGTDSSNLLLDGNDQKEARCTRLEEMLSRVTPSEATLEIWFILRYNA